MPIPLSTLVELCRSHAPIALAVLDRNCCFLHVTERWLQDFGMEDAALIGRPHSEIFARSAPGFAEACQRCLSGQRQHCQGFTYAAADGSTPLVSWELEPVVQDDGSHCDGVVGVAIFSTMAPLSAAGTEAAAISRLLEERDDLLRIERAYRTRLEALRQSALTISTLDASLAERTVELLQLIVEQARALTQADYAALGVGTDAERSFDPWVVSGLSQAEIDAIGRRPRPVGLLGQIAREHRILRLADLRDASGGVGLPANHPPLGPLLGVPITFRGVALGNFYLARQPSAEPFDPQDQAIIELLAGHAAIAIQNARLFSKAFADVRARDEVLAVVSHDLTSPLNAIALREQQLARAGDSKAASHARSVTRSVDDMRRMIRGLLDVTRLDSGRISLERQPVNLVELITRLVESMAPLAHDREVTVDVQVELREPVLLDRERMWQVLANLLSNALKFTPPGGRVTLCATRAGDDLSISVSDTGVGIAPEQLPHVFDRYYTAGHKQRGTGLGLYIAKGLVEAHGGAVEVESKLGTGTIVRLTLPSSRP